MAHADASDVPAPAADPTYVVDQRVVRNIVPGAPIPRVARTIRLDDQGEALPPPLSLPGRQIV